MGNLGSALKDIAFCALFRAYSVEREWIAIEDRLQEPCYLNTDDGNRKIRPGNKEQLLGNILL